jgi:hypothetical protein
MPSKELVPRFLMQCAGAPGMVLDAKYAPVREARTKHCARAEVVESLTQQMMGSSMVDRQTQRRDGGGPTRAR